MDHQNISLMIALFIFLGTPFLFLYVWRTKHVPRLPWKAYLLCLMVCGIAFAAGFFLASPVDSTFYALAYAFQFDRETSAVAAKVAINLMAVLPASLAGLCVVRKIIHSAPMRDS
jgi:drug/metabolite transporter (DMT)-like permease